MRFAIISDVHGNIKALKECLKIAEKNGFDEMIWCGDYVTDFPGGHEVIETIKIYANKYKSYIIKGNRDRNLVDFANGKKFEIKQKRNLEYTYNLLTKEDINWLEKLPDNIEIELGNNKKIYVSHECTYEKILNCKYKIYGHSHKQCDYNRDGIKYINPGSVGITTDENIGAEFVILEITNDYEKIEQYIVKYDIAEVINELKTQPIYNDDIKWGKLLEKELETGIDYPKKCVKEYERICEDNNLTEESLSTWKMAMEIILK